MVVVISPPRRLPSYTARARPCPLACCHKRICAGDLKNLAANRWGTRPVRWRWAPSPCVAPAPLPSDSFEKWRDGARSRAPQSDFDKR